MSTTVQTGYPKLLPCCWIENLQKVPLDGSQCHENPSATVCEYKIKMSCCVLLCLSYGISVNGVKKIRLVRGAIPLVESNGESVKHVS